jgi:hypothetical protein
MVFHYYHGSKKFAMKKSVSAKKKRLELHFYEKIIFKNNCMLIINWCTHTMKNKKKKLTWTYQSHEKTFYSLKKP